MIPQGARLMLDAYHAGLLWRQEHPDFSNCEAMAEAAKRSAYKSVEQPLQITAFGAGVSDWDDSSTEGYVMWTYDVNSGEFELRS